MKLATVKLYYKDFRRNIFEQISVNLKTFKILSYPWSYPHVLQCRPQQVGVSSSSFEQKPNPFRNPQMSGDSPPDRKKNLLTDKSLYISRLEKKFFIQGFQNYVFKKYKNVCPIDVSKLTIKIWWRFLPLRAKSQDPWRLRCRSSACWPPSAWGTSPLSSASGTPTGRRWKPNEPEDGTQKSVSRSMELMIFLLFLWNLPSWKNSISQIN